MNLLKSNLFKQLTVIIVIIVTLVCVLIGIILPKQMTPIYERNIYYYLRQPLEFVDKDVVKVSNQEIAYIYKYEDKVLFSDNFDDIIDLDNYDTDNILSIIKDKYGKFSLNKNTYYYYANNDNNVTKISITNDDYIKQAEVYALYNFFPTILITVLLISSILTFWSLTIIMKIEQLKEKVINIEDDDYDHFISNKYNNAEELKTLELAVEDLRKSLKKNEEYRNQMYQNISHDFKTPLTVIKSYIEALNDNLITVDEGLNVIEEETNKIEEKVHSLLYLNKLDYIKDLKIKNIEEVDILKIVNNSINKFKFRRKELEFIVKIDKNVKYYGTDDFWETITDNLLNNFLRYAKKVIKITIKKDKIIFFNDGENIDESLIDSIFNPYRKGIKGEFGLGLSIVNKTLNYMGYSISVKNLKNGVSFIIYRS